MSSTKEMTAASCMASKAASKKWRKMKHQAAKEMAWREEKKRRNENNQSEAKK